MSVIEIVNVLHYHYITCHSLNIHNFYSFIYIEIRDGVLILLLVLILTRVLFSVLSCTLYLAKFMSTCTRTYLSTVTKNPVLMSTFRVPLSIFF